MKALAQRSRPAAVVLVVAAFALLGACTSRVRQASTGAAPKPEIAEATTPADTVEYRAHRRRLASYASLPGGADSVGATDFAAIRRAYAKSSDYAPYDSDVDLRRAMFGALERSAYAEARRFADSVLSANYLDIFAHVGAAAAADGLSDAQRRDFHQAMAGGLMNAILASGEGTDASPWVVLSIDEEYALLQAQGLTRQMQSLGTCKDGRRCDVMTVAGQAAGRPSTLYFDISWPSEWFSRKFRTPPSESPDA